MTILTRAQILGATDIQTEPVDVPEWGGVVLVRGLTGKQRDAWELSITEQKNGKVRMSASNIRARLVSMAVVDEAGELLFSADDVAALGAKSAQALERVFDKARALSGMTESDVQELEKK